MPDIYPTRVSSVYSFQVKWLRRRSGSRFQAGLWLVRRSLVIGLVIYLIITKPRLHTTANWFVLALAVADFLTGVYFLPSHLACMNWFSCEKSDKNILKRIRWLILDASIACLCAMTADRYLAISRPLKYLSAMKTKRVTLMISAAWLVSLVLNAAPFTWLFTDGLSDEDKTLLNRIFLLTVLLLFEFLPCFVLIGATVHMVVIVRRHLRRTAAIYSQLNFNQPSGAGNQQFRQKTSRDSNSAKVIGVVVAMFVSCYTLDMYLTFCYWFDACSPPGELYFVNKLLLLYQRNPEPPGLLFLEERHQARSEKTLWHAESRIWARN